MNQTLLAKLIEIRDACSIAMSTEDVNLSLVIEEISKLVSTCITEITGTK